MVNTKSEKINSPATEILFSSSYSKPPIFYWAWIPPIKWINNATLDRRKEIRKYDVSHLEKPCKTEQHCAHYFTYTAFQVKRRGKHGVVCVSPLFLTVTNAEPLRLMLADSGSILLAELWWYNSGRTSVALIISCCTRSALPLLPSDWGRIIKYNSTNYGLV